MIFNVELAKKLTFITANVVGAIWTSINIGEWVDKKVQKAQKNKNKKKEVKGEA